MMQKQQVLRNAIISVSQIIVISGVLFVLYRFLLNTIGIKQLGIWSLVLATTSITQIASFGLSGSVVKFVAKYVAREENENVSKVIQTATLSIVIFAGIILLLGYPIAKWLLGLIIQSESFPLAMAILPFALLALWVAMITSIFQGGLDGYQRIDLRSIVLMGGTVFYLILCFILVPAYGLIGIAYAQLIQNIALSFVSWYLLKKCLIILPAFPHKFDKDIFKEIVGYGFNFQIISFTAMFYDPTTKALLSKFGGLSMVGYYEMASKMVQQFRSLIISANQVLVPAIADLHEREPEKIKEVYLTSYQLLFYISLPLYSLIVISIPIISELWIGHYEQLFVLFGTVLSIGWFLNTLSGPSYFANLGVGELSWNVFGHIAIVILNVGLGILFGILYDGIGVVIAWIISLALGSSIIYLSYHTRYRIPFIELVPKASRKMLLGCFVGLLSAFIIRYKFNRNFDIIALNSIIILLFSMIVIIPFWLHPMRKRLIGWINNELLNRK